MKTYLIVLFALMSIRGFTQNIEVTCEPVIVVIDDPVAQHTIHATDLISGIVGGTPPYTYALYTPDGPEQISVSCLDEGVLELEVNVIDADQEIHSCLGMIDVQLSDLKPASDLCNQIVNLSIDENGMLILSQDKLQLDKYCGIQTVLFGQTQFNCSHITGFLIPVPITVFLVDGSSFACSILLEVFNGTEPSISCGANLNLVLPPSGILNLTQQMLGIVATGVCETPSVSLSKTMLSCTDLGQHEVVGTATLPNGNIAQCKIMITITDPLQACSPEAYCICTGNSDEVFIDEVSFAGITQNSGDDDGYADFSDVRTEVQRGNKYLFSLAAMGSNNVHRPLFTRMWIDWNRNGHFERKELALHRIHRGSRGKDFIVIPRNVETGATRMRVQLSLGAPPNPCGEIPMGETEDYTLFISPSSGEKYTREQWVNQIEIVPGPIPSTSLQIFPNPSSDLIFLKVPASMPSGNITISDASGHFIRSFFYRTKDDVLHRIDVSDLNPGIYYVQITTSVGVTTKPIFVQGTSGNL